MKENNVGFTLIELLVVVLIIGILTAIALPQYQKAVAKAQMTEALTNLAVLERAEQACVLANKRVNNTNCTSMDNLDVKIANSNNWNYGVDKTTCYFASSSTTSIPVVCAYEPGSQLDASDNGIPWLSSIKKTSNGAWERTCHATNKAQEKVCEGLSQFGFGEGGYYSSSSSYYGGSSSGGYYSSSSSYYGGSSSGGYYGSASSGWGCQNNPYCYLPSECMYYTGESNIYIRLSEPGDSGGFPYALIGGEMYPFCFMNGLGASGNDTCAEYYGYYYSGYSYTGFESGYVYF